MPTAQHSAKFALRVYSVKSVSLLTTSPSSPQPKINVSPPALQLTMLKHSVQAVKNASTHVKAVHLQSIALRVCQVSSTNKDASLHVRTLLIWTSQATSAFHVRAIAWHVQVLQVIASRVCRAFTCTMATTAVWVTVQWSITKRIWQSLVCNVHQLVRFVSTQRIALLVLRIQHLWHRPVCVWPTVRRDILEATPRVVVSYALRSVSHANTQQQTASVVQVVTYL